MQFRWYTGTAEEEVAATATGGRDKFAAGEFSSNNTCITASERTSCCGAGCAGASGTGVESGASHRHVHFMHAQEAPSVVASKFGCGDEKIFVAANSKPRSMARTTLTPVM